MIHQKEPTKGSTSSDQNIIFLSEIMVYFHLGCPTSYSCHEVSGTFIFEIRIGSERIQSFQRRIFSDGYPSIPRRTWHFRIFSVDIRETYMVTHC